MAGTCQGKFTTVCPRCLEIPRTTVKDGNRESRSTGRTNVFSRTLHDPVDDPVDDSVDDEQLMMNS